METILSYGSHSTLKDCHNVASLGLHQLDSQLVILNHQWVTLSNEIKSFGKEVSLLSSNHLHYKSFCLFSEILLVWKTCASLNTRLQV